MKPLESFEAISLWDAVQKFCAKFDMGLREVYSTRLCPPDLKKYAYLGEGALFNVADREAWYVALWNEGKVDIGLARVKREEA